MKLTSEILEALQASFSGTLKEKQGMKYVPWSQACKVALDLFGADGFDVEVKSCDQERLDNNGVITYGYKAVVRVTVRTSDGAIFVREGLGFSEIVYTKSGVALLDMAIKGAVSGALVRALVLLGNAFGLYLYDGDDTASIQNSDVRTTAQPQNANSTGTTKGLSDKQKYALGQKGFDKAQVVAIERMNWQ